MLIVHGLSRRWLILLVLVHHRLRIRVVAHLLLWTLTGVVKRVARSLSRLVGVGVRGTGLSRRWGREAAGAVLQGWGLHVNVYSSRLLRVICCVDLIINLVDRSLLRLTLRGQWKRSLLLGELFRMRHSAAHVGVVYLSLLRHVALLRQTAHHIRLRVVAVRVVFWAIGSQAAKTLEVPHR